MATAYTQPEYRPALSFVGRPEVHSNGIFDWAVALFLFSVAALQATEYWSLSTYVAYATIPAFVVSTITRPWGSVVRIPSFWVMVSFLVWTYIVGLLSPVRTLLFDHTAYITKVWFVALLLIASCGTYRQMSLYAKAIVLGALFLAVSGAVMGYSVTRIGGERIVGISRQENAFGGSLFHGVLAGVILLPFCTWKWKLIVWLYLPAAFIALLASGSRGAAMAVVGTLAAYVCIEHIRHLWRRPVAIVTATIIVALPLLVSITLFADSPLIVRFTDLLQGRTGASSGRPDIYRQAWELVQSHPFVGLGMGSFGAYSKYVYTHSTFFDLLVGGGVPAFLFYYALYLFAWVLLTRLVNEYSDDPPLRKMLNGCRAALIGLLAHGAFTAVHIQKIPTCLVAAMTGFAARELWKLRHHREMSSRA